MRDSGVYFDGVLYGAAFASEALLEMGVLFGDAARRRRRGVNIGMDVSHLDRASRDLENGQPRVFDRIIIIFGIVVLAVPIFVVVTNFVHSRS